MTKKEKIEYFIKKVQLTETSAREWVEVIETDKELETELGLSDQVETVDATLS